MPIRFAMRFPSFLDITSKQQPRDLPVDPKEFSKKYLKVPTFMTVDRGFYVSRMQFEYATRASRYSVGHLSPPAWERMCWDLIMSTGSTSFSMRPTTTCAPISTRLPRWLPSRVPEWENRRDNSPERSVLGGLGHLSPTRPKERLQSEGQADRPLPVSGAQQRPGLGRRGGEAATGDW
jgi:hypothetical protein